MVRNIGDKVKVSQIIESQLPQFMLDTISTVEEQVATVSSSGTYTRNGKTIIVNSSNHGLSINQRIDVSFLSGFGTNGLYTVLEILDQNTFIISDVVSGKTGGSLNYEIFSQESGNNTVTTLSEPDGYGKYIEFLKQYYISQEYQSGVTDITDNLSNYISLDNLVPEVVISSTNLIGNVSSLDDTISVTSTKGFPDSYGLLKIDDEIITYKSKNSNTFFECIRGFSGITNYHDELNYEELIFSSTDSSSHLSGSLVENLSVLFLKEFLNSIKKTLVPGLEKASFTPNLNVGNFLKESKSLYQTKGTEESFKILFKVLFGVEVSIIDLEKFLIKPSSAKYIRRNVAVASEVSGDILKLKGKQIFNSENSQTSASVSDIYPFIREQKTYYKIYFFVGYDDENFYTTGKLKVTPNTKSVYDVVVTNLPITTVTVDSTIGFPKNGYFIYEQNKIFYTEKTINQFLGCYVDNGSIDVKRLGSIISSDTYYGYDDNNQKIEFRITGILGDLLITNIDDGYVLTSGDKISVSNLGEIIFNNKNPNKFNKFANTWIYNTCTRYQINNETINGSQFEVLAEPYNSSIKIGDNVEIVDRTTGNVFQGYENVRIVDITGRNFTVNISLNPLKNTNIDIRRIQETSESSTLQLKYGNNAILSNVLNVYREGNNGYVASNSLPSYDISTFINEYDILQLSDYDQFTGKYSTIKFNSPVSFLNGDKVLYSSSNNHITGLDSEYYFVSVGDDRTTIKLYKSKSFVATNIEYVTFGDNIALSNDEINSNQFPTGSQRITLYSQRNKEVFPQNLLVKFDLDNETEKSSNLIETPVGQIGMLKNGVEISGYKTNDKIYYGPIEDVIVTNGGTGYDVINPPVLEVEYGQAKVQPVVVGSFEKILVSPQNFSIIDSSTDIVVNVRGGNGSGASLRPILSRYENREVEFDSRLSEDGGGIDVSQEKITFNSSHNFFDGQEIIYDNNGNGSLGIGTFGQLNSNTGRFLVPNSSYYASVINENSIRIYPTIKDFNSGINTVGFTTIGTSGIHKFKTKQGFTITDFSIIDPGKGYSNRKLRINSSSGISTNNNSFIFKNHGFLDGELVEYSVEDSSSVGTPISGLSTNSSYYVIKIDDDTFRIANAGVGGTIFSNYETKKYEVFNDSGTGYQVFQYPKINVNVLYTVSGISSQLSNIDISITPIVRGEIESVYVYDGGIGYGSSVLNLNNSPTIRVKQGKDAQLVPIIFGGKITDIQILSGGTEYYSLPDIEVVSKNGYGAILRPIIANNSIVNVEIINSGSGYSQNDTTIRVTNSGKNAKFESRVRSLTLNKLYRMGKYQKNNNNSFYMSISDEILDFSTNEEKLKYAIASLSSNIIEKLENDFNENSHSPIIGWSYDGCPIYGPYGYSIPNDQNSTIKKIKSGYIKKPSGIFNRPSEDDFESGFFIEDYVYENNGDLDKFNGRFCKTPEFPNGIYAYFATIETSEFTSNEIGSFPYFIGNYYRNNFDINEYRKLNEDFDFYSSNLIRNTHPYRVNDPYSGSDTIIESNEFEDQISTVDSISNGTISKFNIVNGGNNYRINDKVLFKDNDELFLKVSEISGKDILKVEKVENESISYSNSILTYINENKLNVKITPYHILNSGDSVSITGLSTNLSYFSGEYEVFDVPEYTTNLAEVLPNYASTGIVTTVGVYFIPNNISVGSSIQIDSEICKIVTIYPSPPSLKIERGTSGPSHNENTLVRFLPDNFNIKVNNSSFSKFDSKNNDKVYFSPKNSVGYGTTSGITVSVFDFYKAEIPTQSIYLPNHPFKTNQKVILKSYNSISPLTVQYDEGGSTYDLPQSGTSEVLYVINKSKNYIGLSTVSIGATTNSENGIYFNLNTLYSDSDIFSIESDFYKETCEVNKNTVMITTKESHNLSYKDNITLEVIPNSNVGLGTFINSVKYNQENNLILINEKNIDSIDISSDSLIIPKHNYSTGELVFYNSTDSVASGLSTGKYFVYKVNNDRVKLTETYIDSISKNPKTVSINSVGGSGQTLSSVNPTIYSYKNNDLKFDLTDQSLNEFTFKVYYDDNFNKEFVSSEESNEFLTSLGISSIFTIKYSENLPKSLYYNLEKNGIVNTIEPTNLNLAKIEFVDSFYNGSYTISGVGSTTFKVSTNKSPEFDQYFDSDCEKLVYKTTSKTTTGPITKVKNPFKNLIFDSLPTFDFVDSDNGTGASIIASSDTIGRLNKLITNEYGFDYPSDPTLRPTAAFPKVLELSNSYEISKIEIINPGNNYLNPPDVVVLDPITYEVNTTGILNAIVTGSKIQNIDITISPKGLSENDSIVKTINNSNGFYINSVEYSSSGIVTCTLKTPTLGFSSQPLEVGDEIFVENIAKNDLSGDGFNSTDHKYEFFEVTNYIVGVPAKFEYNISGFTTNPGIAKTEQFGYASVTKKQDYPEFKVSQVPSKFTQNEILFVSINNKFFETDLQVESSNSNVIKVSGTYELLNGELLIGKESGSIGTVNSILKSSGQFNVTSNISRSYGWLNNTGVLNEYSQVIPDNDYYQNLSYSIKSIKTWEEISSHVNTILHTSGLKNFSDTEIINNESVGIKTSSETILSLTKEYLSQSRVDTINSFDLSIDLDILN
jgi:hypothetical protein